MRAQIWIQPLILGAGALLLVLYHGEGKKQGWEIAPWLSGPALHRFAFPYREVPSSQPAFAELWEILLGRLWLLRPVLRRRCHYSLSNRSDSP